MTWRLAKPGSSTVSSWSSAARSLRGAVHPFLDHPGPIAFAHRGGDEHAPENTLQAFDAAVAEGFRYLETDTRLSRDGVLVAYHDDRLDRLHGRSGRLGELTMGEIEGHRPTIPRLEEVLTRWPGIRVNIDPKEDAAVAPLVALLDRLQAWDRVCVGSFEAGRLRAVRRLAGARACTSMGRSEVARAAAGAYAGRMARLGADCLQVPRQAGPVPVVTRRFVAAAHRAGLPVHVWTVNDPQEMHALLDLGVDGLMTDRPSVLRAVFDQRGLSLR
jgi:glycerophosphoryl diester phosphodiesterase